MLLVLAIPSLMKKSPMTVINFNFVQDDLEDIGFIEEARRTIKRNMFMSQ